MRTLLAVSAALSLVACATIQPLPYTPNPARIADPKNEVLTLIKANVRPGCIAEPAFEQTLLLVKFVCSDGIGNSTARLDKVESISMQQYEEWYRVVVHHAAGSGDDFAWTSKSLDDMQRLADAFTALTQAGPAKPAAPTNTL